MYGNLTFTPCVAFRYYKAGFLYSSSERYRTFPKCIKIELRTITVGRRTAKDERKKIFT